MPGPWEQFQKPTTDDAPKPWEQFQAKKAPSGKGFGEQLNDFIADVPTQLGLGARGVLQGLGGAANLVTMPVRAGINSFLQGSQDRANLVADRIAPSQRGTTFQIQPISGDSIADSLGLPKPRNTTERVVGDAVGAMSGGLLPIGLGATLASRATGAAQGVGRMMSAQPATQLASAAAGGAAGGYTRETGGNEGSQLLASLAAGLAAPGALNLGGRLAQRAGRTLAGTATAQPIQVDVTINNALAGEGGSGLTLADLPTDVASSLRNDVAEALKIGSNLSPDAVRRLADYRLTNMTPSKASLTLDPADITRQRNLAKIAANSADPAAQQLAQTQNSNNMQMTNYLNDLGAATVDDQVAGAGKVIKALSDRNDFEQSVINRGYSKARNSDGRSAALDHQSFVNDAQAALDEALVTWKVPRSVTSKLEKFGSGEVPLTIDNAEQFKTQLAELSRLSNNGIEQRALGLIRGALEETPLLAGQEIGQGAIDAFNQARALHRNWMTVVDGTPALQAVRAGVEPDQFVQKFIVGRGPKANVMDLTMLRNAIQTNPEAMDAVRQQITAYLKAAAKGGKADEIANFSSSAYDKALRSIGDRKLALFFPAEQVNQLKALGRVALYEQTQPAGTAVNNSGSAAGIGALVDRVLSGPLLGKIPFGRQAIGEPLQNIMLSAKASTALSAPKSLLSGPPTSPVRMNAAMPPWALSPAALAMPGETEEDRRRRLLLP